MRLILLLFMANVAAAQFAKVPAWLRLISDVDAVVPGQTLTVALEIKHAPGYHTYWRNAGTVGLPTSIEWQLPEGFEAGALQYARPIVSEMAIYKVWGYESDTLLLTDITVPTELADAETVTFTAQTQWMACARDCNPGFKAFTLTLPVAKSAKIDRELRKAFDEVRRDQPASLDSWQATAHHNGKNYRLTLKRVGEQGRAVKAAFFFGYERQVASDGEQQVIVTEDGLEFILPREVHMHEFKERLTGMLLCEGGWLADGSHPMLAIDIPLTHGK